MKIQILEKNFNEANSQYFSSDYKGIRQYGTQLRK